MRSAIDSGSSATSDDAPLPWASYSTRRRMEFLRKVAALLGMPLAEVPKDNEK